MGEKGKTVASTIEGQAEHFDLVVIGSGQAGNPLAAAFAAKGKRVAMVERGAVGGTCVNYGCTPTKAMVASAEVAEMARRAGEFGVRAEGVSVDMAAVRERKRGIVDTSRASGEKRVEGSAELLRGEARFTGPKTVAVRMNEGGERTVSGEVVVIDTGLSPELPKVEGIGDVPTLDNVSVMELDQVPGHLLVLGGGYIGLEFGQMFRRFGAEVTVVQHGPQLLEREDADVAERMADLLREDGITILLGAKATRVERGGVGIRLTVEVDGREQMVEGTDLLVATGRKPNTAVLELQKAGVEVDEKGYVRVNDRLETTAAGVYAVGDVKGGPAFTHISYDDYRVLKENLLDGGSRSIAGRLVPYCVYTDPQLGRVGLSEMEAKGQGRAYRVAQVEMSSVARAFETGQTRGFMKALVDGETKQILGAAVLGAEGGELMSMIEIAMMGKLPYTALRDGIWAHPTFAESLNTLFMSLDK